MVCVPGLLIMGAAGALAAILIAKLLVVAAPPALVAVTVIFVLPATIGIPEIRPVLAFNIKPLGKAEEV